MGWKRSTLHLVFDDPEFEGLEVRTRRFVLDDLLLLDSFGDERSNELLEQCAEMLASKILSWNFEDEHDVPVEITPKAFMSHVDGPFFQALTRAIRKASTGVSVPLETPSGDGNSLEAQIPMEPLPS